MTEVDPNDPILDADTDPKIWLFAITGFNPSDAAHCYPRVNRD